MSAPDYRNHHRLMPKHVLVIEDNHDIAHLVELHLRDQNMTVDHRDDGNSGLDRALSGEYDLVILDLMLPGINGIDICRKMREQDVYTPVLMLTARTSELDRVLGLEIGADDYLTKPFSVRELTARVKAILRRIETYDQGDSANQHDAAIVAGDLELHRDKRVVLHRGTVVDLTAREFDLLWHFVSHPGRVYSRGQLLDTVWGHGYEGYEHTVNSHINRLRSKIESDPARPEYVLTVWGVGYKFAEPVAATGG